MSIKADVVDSILSLIHDSLGFNQTLKSLNQLKDGKCLSKLIIINRWSSIKRKLADVNIKFEDIDFDIAYDLFASKFYAIIEDFIKLKYGFYYMASESFKSGDELSLYCVSLLVISPLITSHHANNCFDIIKLKKEVECVRNECEIIVNVIKTRHEPFGTLNGQTIDHMFNLMNRSTATPIGGQKKVTRKYEKLYEATQVLKLVEKSQQMSLIKANIREDEKIDEKLDTKIVVLIEINRLISIFNQTQSLLGTER